MNKCKSFREWLSAWTDGSAWKREFSLRNPDSVYVEVQNYYVKLLCGWKGGAALDHSHLERAKRVLATFDVVLLSEQLRSEAHQSLLRMALQLDVVRDPGQQLKGDTGTRSRLTPVLAPDEVCKLCSGCWCCVQSRY